MAGGPQTEPVVEASHQQDSDAAEGDEPAKETWFTAGVHRAQRPQRTHRLAGPHARPKSTLSADSRYHSQAAERGTDTVSSYQT